VCAIVAQLVAFGRQTEMQESEQYLSWFMANATLSAVANSSELIDCMFPTEAIDALDDRLSPVGTCVCEELGK
jgi:hypothetical protein